MKSKNKRRKGILLVTTLLLASLVFTGFDWDTLANARNVDLLKIFASGMLLGVLIFTLKDLLMDRKEDESYTQT